MMRAGLRRRSRKVQHMPEISLTPLIDTALVLLVIFMIATPIMQNSLNIDLPQGNMKEAEGISKSSLVLSIDARQRLRLNETMFSLDELLEELGRQVKDSKEHAVYVQCDQSVPSGNLVKIIDAIKYVSGVEHVVLTTERARS